MKYWELEGRQAATDMAVLEQLSDAIMGAVTELERDIQTLESRSVEAATTDRDYRRLKSNEYLKTEGTVAEREAKLGPHVQDARFRAKLAEDLRVAALEAIRSRRAKLSALQTLANARKAEIDLVRGPQVGP